MSEAQKKEDREAGRLGATCKKELIKIYCQEVYGRKKDITTNKMMKGTQAEADSIKIFSMVEGVIYEKNEEPRLENEWFTGHPDIFLGESILQADEVWDIKSRWSIHSFMPKLEERVDPSEMYQLQVYYSLTNASGGGIINTLVDCPEDILLDEKRKLLFSMNVASDESEEYKLAELELEKELTFKDIDIRERVIKQEVPRDDEIINKMKAKVPVFRLWLKEFHEKHMSLYPK